MISFRFARIAVMNWLDVKQIVLSWTKRIKWTGIILSGKVNYGDNVGGKVGIPTIPQEVLNNQDDDHG